MKSKSVFRFFVVLSTFIVLLLSLTGCEPVPGRELTTAEKMADLNWIFHTFEQYYAPLKYKEERFGFKFKRLKRQYRQKAKQTKSNVEFYELVYQFMSEFKDAHTSASLMGTSLPGRVSIGYLGFSGIRKGNALFVTSLLPTIQKENGSLFPIEIGDEITHVDGIPISEYALKHMAKYRDLGHEEANLTYHMNRIFNRISIENGLPKAGTRVKLTVRNAAIEPEVREVVLPWIVKDLFDFKLDLRSVQQAKAGKIGHLNIRDTAGNHPPFSIRFFDFQGKPAVWDGIAQQVSEEFQKGFRLLKTFEFKSGFSHWSVDDELDIPEELTGLAKLQTERIVPEIAQGIDIAQTFPAYMKPQQVFDENGLPLNEKRMVGYLRIPTFSPQAEELQVIYELKETLKQFQEYGVKDLVIDLINNGGGSLSLVYQVAQAFSDTKLETHLIEFGLNQQWMDSIENGAHWGPDDAEREIQKQLYQRLLPDFKQRKKLSKAVPVEEIMPFALVPNHDLQYKFNIALLTNEMCASAADIFASMMKMHGLATLIGNKTMGAGGNVVNHFHSPFSHFQVRQTQSLLKTLDGRYLENNGVEPHIQLPVSTVSHELYLSLVNFGFEFLARNSDKQLAKERATQCKTYLNEPKSEPEA